MFKFSRLTHKKTCSFCKIPIRHSFIYQLQIVDRYYYIIHTTFYIAINTSAHTCTIYSLRYFLFQYDFARKICISFNNFRSMHMISVRRYSVFTPFVIKHLLRNARILNSNESNILPLSQFIFVSVSFGPPKKLFYRSNVQERALYFCIAQAMLTEIKVPT